MEKNKSNFDESKYSINDKILLEIIDELNQLKNYSKDSLITKTLEGAINKINYIITENKKKLGLIKNDISSLNKQIEELTIKNPIDNKELQFEEGKYIGQVVNGLQEGKGTFKYNSGSIYEGDWKNGKKEGKGIFYCKKEPFQGHRYDGEWKNDKQEGKGIYFFTLGDMYEGNWEKGIQKGKGIYNYSNGDRYEGDFNNGLMEGKGVYYYSNGERYEGDFRNGKREGKGILYLNNGDRRMGDYLNDQPSGKHVILTKNGNVQIENH